jgi:chromosome partitioning protein
MTAIKIAIGVQKGGVGKTTSTSAIGEALALQNKRVLMVDFDPQASLTEIYGIDCQNDSLSNVLTGQISNIETIIRPVIDGLDIAPANTFLAETEMIIIPKMGADHILRKSLQPILNRYDYVLIDMPPSLGKLAINGLTAADYILTPVRPSILDLRGLLLYLDTIEAVQENTNAKLKHAGVFLTVVDMRLNLHRDARDELKESGLPLLDIMIPDRVKTAEAINHGQSIVRYDPSSDAAVAYQKLTNYILTLTP